MSEQTASAARIADLAGGSEARRSSVFNQLLLDPLLQRLGELRADRDRLDREMDDIVEQLFIRYLSAADLLDSPDKKAGLLKQFEKDGLLDLLIRLGFLSPEALAQKLK